MEGLHAAKDQAESLRPAPRSQSRDGSGDAPAQSTIADLQRRERALMRLLSVSASDSEIYVASVEALSELYEPLLAGVARFQSDSARLVIEHARTGEQEFAPFEWPIAPGLLRELAGLRQGAWRATLPVAKLPGQHLIQITGEADLICEAITCRGDVAGFLFYISRTDHVAGHLGAEGLDSLIALKLSAALDHQAERRARRQHEQQFRDVASTACDWFWEMDSQYRFTYVSDRWLELTGLRPSAYLGKTLEQMGADASQGRWAQFYENLEARRPIRNASSRTVTASGMVRYWKINGKPIFGETGDFQGYRGTGTEVTAEVEQRRRAEKAERLLHEAIEAIPQGFLLFDEHDAVVVANRSYKELYPEIADHLTPGADFVDLVRIWADSTPDRSPGTNPDELYRRRLQAHREKQRTLEHARPDGRAFLINEQKTDEGSTVWLHTDITALKQRETQLESLSEELTAKNHQMDATINAMSDGLVMYDVEDRLMVCNSRCKEMFDLPDELMVSGTPRRMLVAHSVETGLVSADADDVEQKWQSIKKLGDLTYKRTLGNGNVIEVKGVRMDNGGIVMTFRDITLAERQAEALRDSSARLESLNRNLERQNAYFDATLNSMIQGLATFSSDERLIVSNSGFQEIFSLPDGLVAEGAEVAEIASYLEEADIWPDAAGKIASAHDGARNAGHESGNMTLTDGRTFEVQNNLLANGDILVTFHEVTVFEQQAKQLQDYAQKLEFSNRELQEFAYVASHDLQEPLRKIEAFSDRLNNRCAEALDEAGRDYLERIGSASSRMRTLIADLLDYSRISTTAKPLQPIDLAKVVKSVANDLEIALEAVSAELSVADLPRVVADPTQMRQLFQNLISNALKFKQPDVAPVVEVTARMLEGDESEEFADGWVEVTVSDNGIGFDPQYAEQIFKIFHRLHGRSEYEGTGIGLATCRKIMDRHGGSITAQSKPGSGTRIVVKIPAATAGDEEGKE